MCCGPCAGYPVEKFKSEGMDIHGLFFNPNIHPYTEYKKRLEGAEVLARVKGVPLIIIDEYKLEEFLRNASFRENVRCQMCYSTRLERTASVAKKGGFDAFTTTLLISPHQKHDLIIKVGESAAQKYGVKFYYEDLRPGFRQGRELARALEIYMQQYCGCIYSEAERYLGNLK
jgi:predicted adenine nucleotide alpha hydrolase (AANH) superfamily ATPase